MYYRALSILPSCILGSLYTLTFRADGIDIIGNLAFHIEEVLIDRTR